MNGILLNSSLCLSAFCSSCERMCLGWSTSTPRTLNPRVSLGTLVLSTIGYNLIVFDYHLYFPIAFAAWLVLHLRFAYSSLRNTDLATASSLLVHRASAVLNYSDSPYLFFKHVSQNVILWSFPDGLENVIPLRSTSLNIVSTKGNIHKIRDVQNEFVSTCDTEVLKYHVSDVSSLKKSVSFF